MHIYLYQKVACAFELINNFHKHISRTHKDNRYKIISSTFYNVESHRLQFRRLRDETESKKKSEKDKETKKIKQERISRDVRAYTGLALFRIHLK